FSASVLPDSVSRAASGSRWPGFGGPLFASAEPPASEFRPRCRDGAGRRAYNRRIAAAIAAGPGGTLMLARILAFAVAAAAGGALAQTVPAGYPADYAQTIAAANKEGKVVIYSALDTKAAQPLIRDFNAVYPGIKVEYNDMNSTE